MAELKHSRPGELKTRPKAVIFDIGRVIVKLNPGRAFMAVASAILEGKEEGKKTSSLSAEQFWKLIHADERWHDWQEGRLSPTEWHEHLMRRLELSLGYSEFCEAWNLALEPEPILGEDLFARLASRCRLALLSNTDPLHVQALESRFTFGRHFPVRIYSCRVGASKPSPAIYRAALDELGISASQAMYIDDIQEFADAAKQVGMDAICFRSREQLEAELDRRGLS
jgi:FMN phosphatase YigB (HAD superfamily)